MASGEVQRLAELPGAIDEVIAAARRGVLSTVDPAGRPHAVPVVFALYNDEIVTPIDRKPKMTKNLARRKNIEQNPNVALLVDRWSEEWTELAWVMIRGAGSVRPAVDSTRAVEALIARYPGHRATLEGSDVIHIVPERISWWTWS